MFRIESLRAQLPGYPDEIQQLIKDVDPLLDDRRPPVATLRLLGKLDEATEAAAKVPAIVQAVYQANPDDLVAPGASVTLQCALVRRATLARYGARSPSSSVVTGTGPELHRPSPARLGLQARPVRPRVPRRAPGVTDVGEQGQERRTPTRGRSRSSKSSLNAGKLYNALAVLDRRAATDLAAELAVLHPRDELWVLIQYARSRVGLIWGHPAASARELDSAEATGAPPPSPSMADLLLAARVDLAMKRGLGSRCSALLEASPRTTPVLQVRRARLALLAGAAAEAVELTREAVDHPESSAATDLEALVIEVVAGHREVTLWPRPGSPRRTSSAGRRLDAFAPVRGPTWSRGEVLAPARSRTLA